MDERTTHPQHPGQHNPHADIEHLLRMAGEVNAMEAAAGSSPLRLAGTAATTRFHDDAPIVIHEVRSRLGLRIALASAACLGLAAGGIAYWAATVTPTPTPAHTIAMAPIEPPTPTSRVVSQPPLTLEAAAELVRSIDPSLVLDVGHTNPENAREGVVLAIVEDEPGKVRCIRWTDHEWGKGRRLSDVGTGELLLMSTALSCEDNPSRVVVVGLEGPADSLPRGDGVMNLLAECIMQSPSTCGSDSAGYHSSAVQCLPGNVQIKVESLALDQ